jgi:hypothetical protein
MWVPLQDVEGGQIMLLKSCVELEGYYYCFFLKIVKEKCTFFYLGIF